MVKKVKGFKGEYTDEQLKEYLDGRFKQQVIEFNSRCGKGKTSLITVKDTLSALIEQGKRVVEESKESLEAYLTNNDKEKLDGLVDILVTNTMFSEYLDRLGELQSELGDKYEDELNDAILSFNPNDLIVIEHAQILADSSFALAQGVGLFTPKRVYLACELILENNNQKYTNDESVAKDWSEHLKDGEEMKVTEVDGVDYYSVVRLMDGKIMKPKGFKEVVLTLN